MYSPKIAEELIPALYWMAKERKMPMTRLVNGMIRDTVATMGMPEGVPGGSGKAIRFGVGAESAKAVA